MSENVSCIKKLGRNNNRNHFLSEKTDSYHAKTQSQGGTENEVLNGGQGK